MLDLGWWGTEGVRSSSHRRADVIGCFQAAASGLCLFLQHCLPMNSFFVRSPYVQYLRISQVSRPETIVFAKTRRSHGFATPLGKSRHIARSNARSRWRPHDLQLCERKETLCYARSLQMSGSILTRCVPSHSATCTSAREGRGLKRSELFRVKAARGPKRSDLFYMYEVITLAR